MRNQSACFEIGQDSGSIVCSFFSGAMGLDLGIEEAGFKIKLCCESDKFCRQTIALNKPDIPVIGIIYEHNVDEILSIAGLTKGDEIDLVVGGPPCQAFSTAGKRKGLNDERGNVFLKFLELAIALTPKYIVIENVRGLLSSPMRTSSFNQRSSSDPPITDDELRGGALNYVIEKLQSFGYGYSFNLYNSANFGTPQIRERVIIVCARDVSVAPYLIPTHSQDGKYGLPRWKTLRTALVDIAHCSHVNFPEKRLKFYRMLTEGQNWRNLPERFQKEAMGNSYYSGGGRTGFYRRLSWDKPSPTLVTYPAMPATDLAHPEQNRPLSIQEYKRIQEFPDDWQVAGNLRQQYKQIGNSVPIGLGLAVGRLIRALVRDEQIKDFPNFEYSRYKKTNQIEWKAEFERIRNSKNKMPTLPRLALS